MAGGNGRVSYAKSRSVSVSCCLPQVTIPQSWCVAAALPWPAARTVLSMAACMCNGSASECCTVLQHCRASALFQCSCHPFDQSTALVSVGNWPRPFYSASPTHRVCAAVQVLLQCSELVLLGHHPHVQQVPRQPWSAPPHMPRASAVRAEGAAPRPRHDILPWLRGVQEQGPALRRRGSGQLLLMVCSSILCAATRT